jgi:hypothetical protein
MKHTAQAADLVIQVVGVAGFEPTASSSRSNNNVPEAITPCGGGDASSHLSEPVICQLRGTWAVRICTTARMGT